MANTGLNRIHGRKKLIETDMRVGVLRDVASAVADNLLNDPRVDSGSDHAADCSVPAVMRHPVNADPAIKLIPIVSDALVLDRVSVLAYDQDIVPALGETLPERDEGSKRPISGRQDKGIY